MRGEQRKGKGDERRWWKSDRGIIAEVQAYWSEKNTGSTKDGDREGEGRKPSTL